MWLAKVQVALKPVVNDPQGLTILGALHNLGFDGVSQVRAGKFFEISFEAVDEAEAQRLAGQMCDRLLANPVIEDYRFEISRLEGN